MEIKDVLIPLSLENGMLMQARNEKEQLEVVNLSVVYRQNNDKNEEDLH